ncbi:MAG: haloacid dehalogenase [Candidatus Pacebacteria bacterium CG_4_10_14_3_um_filter_34_15]|nr:HAD-IB family phosphatase [Candidatus Paceibacterota bacterium]NCS86544.1 HAD-IB family phosphatase [Candidatus Paceibacterota bacterium]OIO44750.1 MAG: hypothetical protein AUJ41_02110 [Candidatus Pacebacteria bacterium CG1_02_43_31]PIX81367.1 MAG: haloacid dehalogenase [Candidatus Pacebacteria bacterium CG_4_10_14_3_um_filter_34_15]PJC43713.1 MAG: haloacid dehalogenase [Candidatus Pacebacteria bacterium CG_4_9_14_0_2_um_filter_34_50]
MKNIIFDLDSTLSKIEGIDELAVLKNLGSEIGNLTNLAMNGELSLEEAFIQRLEIIQPSRFDLELINQMYLDNITDYAEEVIDKLRLNNNIFIVTGGYKTAIQKIISKLQIKTYFSNKINFNVDGSFKELDKNSPLWKTNGKAVVVASIKEQYPFPTVMIGDGMSDLLANADEFICFSGIVQRSKVLEQVKNSITDLRELLNSKYSLLPVSTRNYHTTKSTP